MKNHHSYLGIIVVLTAILMILPVSPGISPQDVDYSTIDSYLLKKMMDLQPGDNIEIIVQFRKEVMDEDIKEMKRLGIEPIHIYHVIPAVYARGPVSAVLGLSSYSRTFWIEYNMENKLALHETTTVIRANTVWTSEVKDGSYRDFELNPQSKLSGLDGTGVTVVVVDTGIDGQHPDLDYGEKLIMNKHKNHKDDPWIEMQNSDTSYGHGTHCAGIVAGNGDASGGRGRGAAPGARLIGVGGDWTPIYWVVLEGLEWVYDHSKPGNNPYNIRVVSCSWGGAGNYDPQDAITVITNNLTYENNVLCVFAGMNAGENNHDGHEDTTSQQSKIPSVLSVSAATHDGKGMAYFSSRGKKGEYITYPDVSAPGVDVWATRPRYTWLGEYQLIDEDMYYMAISGTSMATPHVAGLAAIMFQAAPSLRTSGHHEDDNSNIDWGPGHDSRIHEVEYILKMTSDMIPHTPGNGIPEEREEGISGRDFDFAQGYGLVNAEKAVALALTLEKMREDEPDAAVDDALKEYKKVFGSTRITRETDTLTTSWRGEWAQLTNGSNPLSGTRFATDQHHRVFIPKASQYLEFDLNYEAYDVNHLTGGRIDVTLDWNGDGRNDINPQIFDFDGNKHYEVDLSSDEMDQYKGKYWTFNVEGEGIKVPLPDPEDEFHEALIEYTIILTLRLNSSGEMILGEREYSVDTSPWRFGEPSEGYSGAEVAIERNVFDVSDVEYQEAFFEEHKEAIAASIIILAIAGVIGYGFIRRRAQPEFEGSDERPEIERRGNGAENTIFHYPEKTGGSDDREGTET